MKAYLPYQISHIYLNEQVQMPNLKFLEQGCYIIFWWKEIALGDIFLNPGEDLLEKEYYLKLIEALRPAINFYANEQEHREEQWEEWVVKRQFEKWITWMNIVFTKWLPNNLPPSVPVTVVVCTHNRSAVLQLCLELLTKQVCQAEEIIVIDNAPADDFTQRLVKHFEQVTYIKEPRLGLDIARNIGLRNARLPIVAFVDDDVTVNSLWVYKVWETFNEPAIAAMTGLVIAAELETESQYIFEKYWSFNRGYTDVKYNQYFFNSTLHKGPPVWKIGAGANMAFRKAIFEEVGYFNEILDAGAAGCNGDSEMWFRILAKGYNIKYNPRAVVFHEHRKKIEDLKKQIFYYMRGYTTAALIQQKQYPQARYKKYMLKVFPIHYCQLIIAGFPHYPNRFRTIWEEMKGILSGLVYYYKHRNQPNGKY